MRVLVVCAGNICRSPAAAAAINQEARAREIDVEADSAGTGSWNIGEPPHPLVVAAGARVGLVIEGRARKFSVTDFERYEAILVMDRTNLRDVLDMAPNLYARAKVRLFRTYDPNSEEDEVPDPYGGPEIGYGRTVEIVRSAAVGLLDTLASSAVEDAVALDEEGHRGRPRIVGGE